MKSTASGSLLFESRLSDLPPSREETGRLPRWSYLRRGLFASIRRRVALPGHRCRVDAERLLFRSVITVPQTFAALAGFGDVRSRAPPDGRARAYAAARLRAGPDRSQDRAPEARAWRRRRTRAAAEPGGGPAPLRLTAARHPAAARRHSHEPQEALPGLFRGGAGGAPAPEQKARNRNAGAAGAAGRAEQRWSLDFVSDALDRGRRFRVLAIVDDFTREALALVVDTSIGGRRLARELDALVARRGRPAMIIVSDNVLCREAFAA